MKIKNNQTNFAVTGAAALLVGLAGTAQAIPFPVHTAQSIIQSSANKKPANQALALLPAPAPAQKAGKNIQPAPVIFSSPGHGLLPVPSLTVPIVSSPGHGVQPMPSLTAPIVSIPEQGVLPMPSLTMPAVSPPTIAAGLVHQPVAPAAASTIPIPDGGPTGAMLGGVFGGLALLRKKLKA
jgi:hypothetical protein